MKKGVETVRLEPVTFWLRNQCLSEHNYRELLKIFTKFNQFQSD